MAKRPDRPAPPKYRDPAKHSKKDPAKPTRAKAAREPLAPLDPSLAELLNPGIGRGRAGVGSQTGLEEKKRAPSLPPPGGGSGGGSRGDARRVDACRERLRRRASPPDPHPWPLPTRGRGRASAGEEREHGEPQPSKLAPPPDNSWDRRADFPAHRARASVARGFGEPPQQGYVGKTPAPPGELDPELARALGIDEDDGVVPKRAERGAKRDGAGAFALRRPGPSSGPSPASPASNRSTNCCARAARSSAIARGRRTGRRGRRNPKAASASSSSPTSSRRATSRRRSPSWSRACSAQRPHPGAARRHRLGQDLHHGEGDRGDAAPGADPRAEQDARRAALWRVQELLSRQRGRVFRLLLRLLPARGLRPAHRHLYREGILDQRADRPHAPFGDARAARARRRHHRRLGVVHLRHRLGRDLFGDDLRAEAAASASTSAQLHRRSRRAAIQAHGRRFLPRHVPRARRHDRASSRRTTRTAPGA